MAPSSRTCTCKQCVKMHRELETFDEIGTCWFVICDSPMSQLCRCQGAALNKQVADLLAKTERPNTLTGTMWSCCMQVDHPILTPVCVQRYRADTAVPMGLEDGCSEVVADQVLL